MLNALFQFEWRYHIHQKSFLFGFSIFLVLGFVLPIAQAGMDTRVFINAPYNIAWQLGLSSLGAGFVLAVIASNGMLRDVTHNTVQLVYTTPVKKGHMLFSRIAGVFVASFLIFAAAPLGMLASAFIANVPATTLAPINPLDYLWVFGVLVLPSMFFLGAILVTVALATRSQLATLIAALVLFIGYFIGATYAGSPIMANAVPASPDVIRMAALLDPYGLSAFFEQTKHWSIDDRNTRQIALEGVFLHNRLLWTLISAGVLALLYRFFSLKLLQSGRKPRRKEKTVLVDTADTGAQSGPRISYSHISPVGQHRPQLGAFWATLKLETRLIIYSLPFVALTLLWIIASGGELIAILSTSPFSTPVMPTTAALLERIQYDVLPRLSALAIIFYSGEIMWRERALKVDAFTSSSPTGNIAFFASKFLALCTIPVIMITLAIVLSVLIQLGLGYSDIEPLLYLSVYYYGGLPLFIVAALALFCQSVTPNRYLGMALCAVIYFLPSGTIGAALGIEHPMFAFAQGASLSYSDMSGYNKDAFSWATYMVYWCALAGLLAWVAWKLWPRGSEGLTVRRRIRSLAGNIAKVDAVIVGSLLTIFIVSGSFIFHQTNIEGNYRGSDVALAGRANYETLYKRYAGIAQPEITDVSNHIDIYPDEKRIVIDGNYVLTNKTSENISDVLVYLDADLDISSLAMDGASLFESNETLGQYIFRLQQPLAPGSKVGLQYAFALQQNGFKQMPGTINLVENGTLVQTMPIMPMIGYMYHREIRGTRARQKFDLPELPLMPVLELALQASNGPLKRNIELVNSETILSTSLDQKAVTVGKMIRSWEQDGRRYFHYKTEKPINNVTPFVSARYEVKRSQHKAIDFNIFYSPSKMTNIDGIEQALHDSIDYYTLNFGPYPATMLNIVQASAQTGVNGYAAPGLILMAENTVFNFDVANRDILVDHTYRVTAHEVAHQWWAHQLTPADGSVYEGSMTLVETLARYSELMMLEHKYGPEITRRWVDYENGRYLAGRASESQREVPLYRVGSQRYIMYSKGALAMYAIRQQIGEQAVNKALRSLITDYADYDLAATSLDLVNALYNVAEPADHVFIDNWFKRIIHYDLAIYTADVTQQQDGVYRLDLPITASRNEVDETGTETPLLFDHPVEIAVSFEAGETIYSKQLIAGENIISLDLDTKPVSVSLDPAYKLIDVNRSNNTTRLD